MTTVVAGATGFVGSRLVKHLRRPLRLCSRRPEQAARLIPEHPWVHMDVDQPDSLDAALEGADALVYLVHGMKHGSADLVQHEEACAARVLSAAERAGVRRIVYLGGPRPQGPPSEHLRARLRTGEVLRSGEVSTIELRAGMIIGAGSESWTIVRDLARRLPLMVLPSWLNNRSQPVALTDVLVALEAALDLDGGSVALDVPGPEVLTARQILERVAALEGEAPPMLPVPVLSPALSSHWIGWVTRADVEVARQLVEGLVNDLLAEDDGIWMRRPDLHRTPLDLAMRRALEEEAPLGRPGRILESLMRRLARRA